MECQSLTSGIDKKASNFVKKVPSSFLHSLSDFDWCSSDGLV